MKGKFNIQTFIFSNLTNQFYLRVYRSSFSVTLIWRWWQFCIPGGLSGGIYFFFWLVSLPDIMFDMLKRKWFTSYFYNAFMICFPAWLLEPYKGIKEYNRSMYQQKQCCQNNLSWDRTHVILVSIRGLLLYELRDALTTLTGRQSCRWLDWDYL